MLRPAHVITLSLLALLAWAAVRPGAAPSASAADADADAWGATEPTWSPDSKQLAVSLFGSIWVTPRDGGAAAQLTSSGGFHDHPAWSPDGASIAYVIGSNPRGQFAKISGELAIVDVATGSERKIPLPFPTGGTPDWSADGSKIICPLLAGGAGALIYQIDAASGSATALQSRPQRNPAGRWVEVSAGPEEIVFAAQRVGTPQIWSMATERRGLTIQTPLTRYLPEHIVNLDGVSALPDGGAVFSADVINGAGNFELYRAEPRGGEPTAITATARHELSPEVSPDGSTVAFSSNLLGNIDVFTMPAAGGERRHVRIDSLDFRRPSGAVRVKVLDELGQPTSVRLYVEASDGKGYAPRGEPIFYYPLEPGGRRDAFFVATGEAEFPAPTGLLRLTAVRGVEYRLSAKTLDIVPGQTTEVTFQLERWTNWNQRGWYSGENHFHANYLGSYYQRPTQSLAWLKAMDLNAANMIVANAQGAFVHDKEFFTGALSPLSTDRRFLYWGQEYRNSDPLGHMGFLNIKRLVAPSYTSVPGSDSPYDFPLNTMAALEARRQGGLVTYMHPLGGSMRDVFDTNLGAKESVVTAALGGLDTIDLLPHGDGAYELWYTLLNCGIKIAAGAGTDSFTNWRGINRIPGGSRQYVHVGGKMSWDRWVERYREGRSFATSGPLLTFSVGGSGVGEEIPVRQGAIHSTKLSAEVMSRTPLDKVEFIRNGRVIESVEARGARRIRLDKTVEIDSSSWFAARVYGPGAPGLTTKAMAHSSPVYVSVDGRPTLVREDLEMAVRWVDRLWAYLVERDNFGPAPNREEAQRMIDDARRHYLDKLALL